MEIRKNRNREVLVMERINFNLNQHILVKLKDEGFEHWKKAYNEVLPDQFKKPLSYFKNMEKDGYVRFQAWDFMRLFGETITLGVEPLFYPDIIILQLKGSELLNS
jgi:hypothetical protein